MDHSSPHRVRNPIELAGALPPIDVPLATEPVYYGETFEAPAVDRPYRVPDHYISRAIGVVLIAMVAGVLAIMVWGAR